MICTKVSRDLRLSLFRWLEGNTSAHMPEWGLGFKYMFFDGIDSIHLIHCPSGQLVTPNEFKRRVREGGVMMKSRCKFSKAWTGRCDNETIESFDMCEEHRKIKCVSCGKQATKECAETMGPLVCGAPLCDDCEHTICDNGCNSGGRLPKGLNAHCKKSEQVFKPWYMKEQT